MPDEPEQLVEHFFRHESANLIALLTRGFGFALIDVVEDMVQEAMLVALRSWRINGIPANPAGWLHRVAKNRVIDTLRRSRVSAAHAEDSLAALEPIVITFSEEAIQDSVLRLIFVCCHPTLDRKSQLALTLKVLCGLGDHEIACGLLMKRDAVKKRVTRAKQHLQLTRVSMELPPQEQLHQRLDVVHEVLYLLFNEGYSSSKGDVPIRADMCEEAARLCHLLCESDLGQPATFGLLSLMLFHAARLDSRMDGSGNSVLLQDQDRSKWDRDMIQVAEHWLRRSATGGTISRFHLEAGIVCLHCSADSFEATNWNAIVGHYDMLMNQFPSPMYLLNRAIAKGRLGNEQKTKEAIAELQSLESDPNLERYPLLWCSLADLHLQAGDQNSATKHLRHARALTHTDHDRSLIDQKLNDIRRKFDGPNR